MSTCDSDGVSLHHGSESCDNKENKRKASFTMPVASFYCQVSDDNCYPIFKKKNGHWSQRESFTSMLNKPLGKSKLVMKPVDKKRSATKRRLEQMTLDVGQKGFGPVTCKMCGMLYSPQNTDDAEQHAVYHKRFTEGIKFPGWRHERVLHEYDDGRVIMVIPSDPKSHQNKIREVCSLIDLELGYPVVEREIDCPTTKVLLFICDRRVCGGLIAEMVHEAYPLIAAEDSGTEQTWFIKRSCPQSVMCGVNRLWVCKKYRLCSIATRMMDCLRENFICGMTLCKNQLAFSDPTVDGRAFATKYFSNPSFLVYSRRHH